MKERKPEIIYSDPVREIMGTPPAGIVRAGTIAIFILFLLLILLSWLIKYPDTIPSTVEITTTNPPVTMVSKVSGRIKHLYVTDKARVTTGQLIAVMETAASAEEVTRLGSILDTMRNALSGTIPGFSHLGELQEYYAVYWRNLENLKNFEINDSYGVRIESARREIAGIREYISRLSSKERIYLENYLLERKKFVRDSGLLAGKAISLSQLELSKQSVLQKEGELQNIRLERSQKNIDLLQKEQSLNELRINQTDEKQRLTSFLDESFLNLKARMNIWKTNYFLVSPVDGTATFTKYWSSNQSVLKDEPVLTIVPDNPGEFIGRTSLKMQRSGKVKTGMRVNIKLSGFPYLEYGMVRGEVSSKSLVPDGNTYIIEISLPHGLVTTYGDTLDFNQNMQGIAEIITEDTRLLQKMINPFRYMISKNRQAAISLNKVHSHP